MRPLLSILIPTRNREAYCIDAIESILSNDFNRFELVVQDNSDSISLKDYLEKNIDDRRLLYNYTPPPLSSIENFNKVIDLSSGEYLCMIGDDDGVNPDIFKVVEFAAEEKISVITPTLKAIYKWPDACKIIPGLSNFNGLLSIYNFSGSVTTTNNKDTLLRLLHNGGQDYLNLPFPKLYHGIVKREHIERIKTITGNYVGGLSPDIYLATALSLTVQDTIIIDYPLTIPGACVASTPLDEKMSNYVKLTDAPHFRNRGKYSWSSKVPRFYCGSNIWSDSLIAALNDFNRVDLINKFNVFFQLATILNKYKDKRCDILKFYYSLYNANDGARRLLYSLVLKSYILTFRIRKTFFLTLDKAKRLLTKSSRIKLQDFENISSIKEATGSLTKYLRDNNISVENVIEKMSKT